MGWKKAHIDIHSHMQTFETPSLAKLLQIEILFKFPCYTFLEHPYWFKKEEKESQKEEDVKFDSNKT